jgi:hypothetical protein
VPLDFDDLAACGVRLDLDLMAMGTAAFDLPDAVIELDLL